MGDMTDLADVAVPAVGYRIHPQMAHLEKPASVLRTLPGNPRRGDVEAVAKSIARFGQRRPCTVVPDPQNEGGWVITAGNHTFLAATTVLGWDGVACLETDDPTEVAKAWAAADNRTGDLAHNDDVELALLLKEVAEFDINLLYAASYTEEDLSALLDQAFGANPGQSDPDSVPPLPQFPFTEQGMVWLLGPHRLVCGDAADPEAVRAALGGRLADMVWTDPWCNPGKGFDPVEWEADIRLAFGNAHQACRAGAVWYVTGPDRPPAGPVLSAVLADLEVWRLSIVWVKDRPMSSRDDFQPIHEVVYTSETGEAEQPVVDPETGEVLGHESIRFGWKDGKHHKARDRRLSTVWEVPALRVVKGQEWVKPCELVERAVVQSSIRGETILDPFAGSGTTLIAAHRNGRVGSVVEVDPLWCDVVCSRFESHTGIVPVLEGRGPRSFQEG